MKYAVISMAFVRMPDGWADGPWLPEGIMEAFPHTEDGDRAMMSTIINNLGTPPNSPGIWIRRFKLKLDGDKIEVLWARWKEATIEEAKELQRVIEAE